jgi:hypothetical protein
MVVLNAELISQTRTLLTSDQNSELTDEDVMRFIIARKQSIKKAVPMIEHYCEWYDKVLHGSDTLTPKNILDSVDPDEHIYQKYFPHANLGFSKTGCPIYWEKTGICSGNFPAVTKHISPDGLVIRHVRQQEYVFRERCKHATNFYGQPITRQLIVFDLKGLVYSLDTHAMGTFRNCLKIDESFYPERLDHIIMINVPWFFTAIWAMIKPWIDPVTAEKFVLIGSDYLSTLRKYIDDSQIPVELGGNRQDFSWTFPQNRTLDDHNPEILGAACPLRGAVAVTETAPADSGNHEHEDVKNNDAVASDVLQYSQGL